nr:unnamed protein product [Callosobruchus chinensis]
MLFSDESRFGLVSGDYRERVWRKRGQNRLATAIVDFCMLIKAVEKEIESPHYIDNNNNYYTVSLLVMVIGSLGGMRNSLLSALRAMPVCRAAAHILAARMQKADVLGVPPSA